MDGVTRCISKSKVFDEGCRAGGGEVFLCFLTICYNYYGILLIWVAAQLHRGAQCT
jgi:hypothetical protein